jgi:hypothetical protein
MTNIYSEMYKRKVSKLEEQVNNLRLLPCKISFIVDTAIKVEDASKKVDAVYIALPSKIKEEEKDTHQKSIDLINKYRTIITDMDSICDCKQR